MIFERDFFEDEVRCGYPIIPMIKRGWAAGLAILETIDGICRKHDIKYFANYGTLLGAIRHNGFIPWDDDIDIAMKREDYIKFLEIAPAELPKNYSITNIYKKDMHCATLAGVRYKTSTCLEDEFIISNYGCPASIGVDIFVFDYLPQSQKEKDELAEAIDFLRNLRSQYVNLSELEQKEQLLLVKKSVGVEVEYSNYVPDVTFKLGRLLEDICMLYNKNDSNKLTNMMVWQRRKDFVLDAGWFDEVDYVAFENMQIPIPKGAINILELEYENYKELKKSGSAHSYPYYEQQYINNYIKMGGMNYTPDAMLFPRPLTENNEKDLVIFVVMQSKRWSEIEFAYIKEIEKKNDVYVMPIPYYIKDIDGSIVEVKYEGNDFPSYLPLIDYDAYNLEAIHPNRIYYQNPWDEWHEILQVPQEYCCEELYICSDFLIYVPINRPKAFDEKEERTAKMLDYSVRYPGMIISDRILLDDKKLRNNYINALVRFTGEHTRDVWEEKVYSII